MNLRKGNLETLLNGLENLLVLVVGDERDGDTLGTETTGTTDTVKVRVGVGRKIVIDRQVDALDIDTTTEDVGGDADALVEVLELLVAADTIFRVSYRPSPRLWDRWDLPLLLADTRVDSDGREVALAQELVKLRSTQGALDEDDDLVELELIEQLVELAVLLALLQRNAVLLETVQGQLGVLVDVVLGRVLHELLADGLDLVGEGGREHHDLLLLRRGTEDLLDVTAHVDLVEHLVALVKDEHADATQTQVLVPDKRIKPTGSSNDDVRVSVLVLEKLGILHDGGSTVEDADLDLGHVLGETSVLVLDLEGQLASVAHDHDRALAGDRLDLLEGGEDEDGSLSETGLGLADDVSSKHGLGNADLLNCSVSIDVRTGLRSFGRASGQ